MDRDQIVKDLTELIDDMPAELHLNSDRTNKLSDFLKDILLYFQETAEKQRRSSEIKDAMLNFTPVMYKGIIYKNINAYIYRVYKNPQTRRYKEAYQLELQDVKANSITIANAEEVQLL